MKSIKNYQNIPNILLTNKNFKYGRSGGKITVRHRGGGLKYLYTNIDFKYFNYTSSLALILKFYVDFSRTTIIMLIIFLNGKLRGFKKLMLSTNYLKIGDLISFTSQFPTKVGSLRFIAQLCIGMDIHSLETKSYDGSSVARSFGTRARIIYHTSQYTCVKLPSGQFKFFYNNCRTLIGQNSILYKYKKRNKAGDRKFKNLRPTVRGAAMNAVDHPHGGGCGRTPIGLRSRKTPWGKFYYGIKTKRRYAPSKFIVF